MANEGLRTTTAQHAMVIAEIVNRSLADRIVGDDPPKRLVIKDVDGPSTEGGKRARQAIVLAPVQAGEKGASVCGFLDTVRGEAEVRTYDAVAALHRQRYGQPFDVSREEYEQLVGELVDLFAIDSVEVRFADAVDSPPQVVESPGRRRAFGPKLALALGCALAVILALLALR